MIQAQLEHSKQGVVDDHLRHDFAVGMTPYSALSCPAPTPRTSVTRTVSDVLHIPRVDPTQILEDALDQVKELKQQYYLKSVVTGSVDIPSHLAKRWIHSKSTSIGVTES